MSKLDAILYSKIDFSQACSSLMSQFFFNDSILRRNNGDGQFPVLNAKYAP